MNRDNLDKLATYLEKLPVDYEHFAMDHFIGVPGDDDDLDTPNPDLAVKYGRENGGLDQFGCGAVGCAVGHGPAAGVFYHQPRFGLFVV